MDDIDDNKVYVPLLTRLARLNSRQSALADLESDNDSNDNRPSTSLKRDYLSDYESQDEDTVSSARQTDVDVGTVVKRKRGRPKKDHHRKKIRLSDEQNIAFTASSSVTKDKLRNNSNSEFTIRHNNLENR